MFLKLIFMKCKCLFYFIFLGLLACKSPEAPSTPLNRVSGKNNLKYAKRFATCEKENFTLVYLFGNRENYDTTATFIICSDSATLSKILLKGVRIKSPCTRIAALSSIYATLFCELGDERNLVAIHILLR